MNLNQRIEEIRGDGIPGYNTKLNQMIRTLNWLMGVRVTNGRPVRESDSGPVFDLSPAIAQGGNQLWTTDPDGNPAGWSLITCLNLQTNQSFQTWIWTGQTAKNVRNIPWMFDPANNQAGWIVCPSNTFWGTGQCSGTGGTCTSYLSAVTVQGSPGANPQIWTSNPQTPPITPPTLCTPRFYLEAAPYGPNYLFNPILSIQNGLTASDPNSAQFNFTYTVSYDGVQVYSFTGTAGAVYATPTYFQLPTAGWQFNPASIPGYSPNNNSWLYLFNGAASTNTNPTIVQTFSYTFMRELFPQLMRVVYMTG